MKEKLSSVMKNAASAFLCAAKKKEGASDRLKDNYYILERKAARAQADCRRVQKTDEGSETLLRLFDRCVALCDENRLPDDEKTAAFFAEKGLLLREAELLPLALMCALVNGAANALKAPENKSDKLLSAALKSMRSYEETDFEFVFYRACEAERLMSSDPTGIYGSMDEVSKSEYRKNVIVKSKKENISEIEFIKRALDKAKKDGIHFGKYIIDEEKNTAYGKACIAVEIFLSAAISACISVITDNAFAGALLFFPLWQFIQSIVSGSALKKTSPSRFLRLKRDDERVMNCEALIVLSTLLPAANRIDDLKERLEGLYLSNCTGKIKVCCLADFKSSETPSKPEDKPDFKAAREMTDALNLKYGGGFIFALRPRAYSKTQNEFTGEERKRGAVTALVKAISGDASEFEAICGDKESLSEVKFLAAADYDTVMPFDSVREMISVALHPMNRPVIDKRKGRVTKGYGIIVPRSENRIDMRTSSTFARLMAAGSGISSYSSVINERYQDLFGEGIFCGKGLIDVESYHALLCNAFPKERILSHDILEGGYLRAGYASDIRVTEEIPQSVTAYFRRSHRWVRGDWQNIPFIFARCPLNFISRYKLFDNIRRSLNTFFCMAAVVISCFFDRGTGELIAASALTLLSAPHIITGVNALIHNGFGALTRLSFSHIPPPALASVIRAFCSVALSVHESVICFDAVCRSLWRMAVSKKHLLDWTTAANSERKGGMSSLLIGILPGVIVSLAIFVFGTPVHRLTAIILLFDVPLSLICGNRRSDVSNALSDADKETLRSYASAMWGFFNEMCDKENNYLPPDNIQMFPSKAIAHRTSPTNIGLMLTSFLAARDMDLITSDEMCERLEKSFRSIGKLEKFSGNLLNWYDTRTLLPLTPEFVSAVDSGNFICCLVALKEGLKEYTHECPKLKKIISECEKIIDDTDLLSLYDRKKELFCIGIDARNGRKSEGCYDLQMSEATLTSYFAVAKRIVPVSHWSSRSRILVKSGRYTGLASWTGTMFEYFMPNIFLSFPKGSMLDESLQFCLYCQKKRAGNRPFGVSESGFFAFDANMNYQYKAHGVKKLGLRRGLDDEYVVSPYSSFLTLTAAAETSVKNLKKLKKAGAWGKYGFYEAVDYTPKRRSGKYSIVGSFMAHHVGMSFLSVDNMLNGNIIRRRFMRDPEMRGAKSLLDEKTPIDEPVFKDIYHKSAPDIRSRVQTKSLRSEQPSPVTPCAGIYSNGRMTLCITDVGTSFTRLDGSDITVYDTDIIERPTGVFGVFSFQNKRIPFVKALDYGNSAKYKAEFQKNQTEHTAVTNHVKLKMRTCVLQKYDCEIRRFTIENTNKKKPLQGKLTVYFEPCLTDRESFSAHPAFSRIFICDDIKKEEKCVVFRRKNRGEKQKCCITVGFEKNIELKFNTLRETAINSPFGAFSIGKSDVSSKRGNPDCCFCADIKVDLKAGESKSYDLIISAADTEKASFEQFMIVRTGRFDKEKAFDPFFSDTVLNSLSRRVIPRIICGKSFIEKKAGKASNYRIGDIWAAGISADLPMILLESFSPDEAKLAEPYIKINKCLRNCGIMTDIVIFIDEKDEYNQPIHSKIKAILSDENCELMIGVKGGVHLVDKGRCSPETLSAIRENAVMTVNFENGLDDCSKSTYTPARSTNIFCDENNGKLSTGVKRFSFTTGKILIKNNPQILDIPWNIILSGKSLGTMMSDKSLGFTWALDSRENKLTPWYNDASSDNCAERIIVKINGEIIDIAASSDAIFTPDRACWLYERNGLRIIVTVEVSEVGMCKKCSVAAENLSDSHMTFDLMYYTLPVLGVSRDKCGAFSFITTDSGVIVSQPFSVFKGFFYLSCSSPTDHICFSRSNFFEGNFDSCDRITGDACAAIGKKINLNAGERRAIDFFLSWSSNFEFVKKMPSVSVFADRSPKLKLNIENKKLKIFAESFLYSQVKQCRFRAKTGFYQCSGAFGFRDQLQDCLSLISTDPVLVRTHILRCAAVQFEQGDVLHWWHVIVNGESKIPGVRTKCSDDMLWLIFVCEEYISKTGDKNILNISVPFIEGEMLAENEKEKYMNVSRSSKKATLFEHCVRALKPSSKCGKHGLPLIGLCDWNDGLSNLCENGEAESVWLAMFRIVVLKKMIRLCDLMSEKTLLDKCENEIVNLRKAVENNAWSGNKYIRAFDGNGDPLGGDDFTDILPQAFSVFAGLDERRTDIALTTAYERLFDKENGVIRLFSQAFDEKDFEKIGYLASYPEGIRENSGQYTHAAVWLVAAMLEKGRKSEAQSLLSAINPLEKYDKKDTALKYRAEPYVLAADVGYGEEIKGRAGWTHFTGSASWLLYLLKKYEENL